MSDCVYVFVDESGSHTRRDCYVVVGCWCGSSYADPKRVLQPTRNRLSDNVFYEGSGPSPGREIKGTRSDEAKLNNAFAYLRNVVDRDDTIRTDDVPWDGDRPVRFTTFVIDSELSTRITRRYLGEGRTYTTTQVVGLASILTPLVGVRSSGASSKVRVILDADTWKRASTVVDEMLDARERLSEIEFETHDSTAIPGIQLSDIAAYARRKRLLEGTCDVATDVISSLEM